MLDWKSPKDELPTQGLFVLCWWDGLVYCCRRMGDYWFPIPFVDSSYAHYNPPEKWAYITFPDGYTGKLRFKDADPKGVDRLLEMDEFELFYPEDFQEFVQMIKKSMHKRKRKKLV